MNILANRFLRKTKIVATIGPSTSTVTTIESLLQAGMDVARINFSHGTYREHVRYIKMLRAAAKQLDFPLAILQDLPGPKDRTGKVKKGVVTLNEGSNFIITTEQVLGDENRVSVSWPDLPKQVRLHNTIFIGDGDIKLEVIGITATDIKCRVLAGGKLGDNKGINIPGVTWDFESVTEEDYKHLEFGIRHKVDFVAVSFVRKADDILKVKHFLQQKDANIRIIAKIERDEALNNLDEILEVSDGAMVARGDLGLAIPIQKVPIIQKQIIHKCNQLGKPVIVATQMLESMVEVARPTRAEVTDVANAIFDGADAVMLSEETAIGRYPKETVEMMALIALEAEAALPYEDILLNKGKDLKQETDDAISYDACHTARQLNAVAIVAFTSSGSTARRVSKYRPEVPIIAITASTVTTRQLALTWGVNSFKVPAATRVTDLFKQGASIAQQSEIAREGDLIVITGGIPVGIAGSTNMLKVEKI